MNITLNRLTSNGFAGKDFDISFDSITTISGPNMCGKTRIFSAWTWLITNENSIGETRFNIRNLADMEKDITVEAVISHDGTETNLKKINSLMGTTCYINDVPKKKKDYESFIQTLIPAKVLPLLTNTTSVSRLHWSGLLAILSDMFTVDAPDGYGHISNDMMSVDECLKKANADIQHLKAKLLKSRTISDELTKWVDDKQCLACGQDIDNSMTPVCKEVHKLSNKITVDLPNKISECCKIIADCEIYKREVHTRLAEKVNSYFKSCQFRFFDNYKETCEMVKDGVPFKSFSTGQELYSTIELVEAISEHYGCYLPLFVDNAESLTIDVNIARQVIYLKAKKINGVTVERA